VNTLATSCFAIGARVWYRRGGMSGNELRGIVEDIALGVPPVTYYVRLESRECVWAAFSDLLPR
jgi:hypothetical protein